MVTVIRGYIAYLQLGLTRFVVIKPTRFKLGILYTVLCMVLCIILISPQ